jgi:hypothetical protein
MSIEKHLGLADEIFGGSLDDIRNLGVSRDFEEEFDPDLEIDDEELDVDSKDDFCMGDLDEFDEEVDIEDSELEIDEDDMIFTDEVMVFEDDNDDCGDPSEALERELSRVSSLTHRQRKELEKLLVEEEYVIIHGKPLLVNKIDNMKSGIKQSVVDDDTGEKTLAEEIHNMKEKNAHVLENLLDGEKTGIKNKLPEKLYYRLEEKYTYNIHSSWREINKNIFELIEDLEISDPIISNKLIKAFAYLKVRSVHFNISFYNPDILIGIDGENSSGKKIKLIFDDELNNVIDIKVKETVEVTNEIEF